MSLCHSRFVAYAVLNYAIQETRVEEGFESLSILLVFTKQTYLRQWYRVEEDVGVVLCGFIQLSSPPVLF